MNLDKPEISVIMPVFNRREVVRAALESLERQTFQDFELLVVDDGSTDGLEQMMAREVLQRPNWRYLKHANRNVARSRNIGIRAALGIYVTFLDSDDEYLPEHLEKRWEYCQQHPDVDFIHGGVLLDGPENTHWVVDARDPQKKIHISECCVGATLFGKRERFLQAGGFPVVSYSPEYHFLEKIKHQYRIERVSFPTYVYHTAGEDRICRSVEK